MATAFKNPSNNAVSTTTNPTGTWSLGVTSITVASGTGTKFAATPFYVSVWTGSDPSADANMEVLTCTAVVGDVLTVTPTLKTHTGTQNIAELVVTQQFGDIHTAVNALENATNASSFIQNEVPTGSVNSSNTAFTTASNMATGSLRVYRNGIRLKGGGVDFTQGSNNAFTMVTAPVTGDTLLVDYNVSATGFSVGTNSSTTNQTPTGLVNSSNTSYTVLQSVYIAGSLQVYIDGIMQKRGTDYTETTPASGVFTMTTAPVTGQTILVDYQFNLNPSSNTDTVDGVHASATGGSSGSLIADYLGGWWLSPDTLTYATANSATAPGDLTGRYSVGDKVRLDNGGAPKYFYISSLSFATSTTTFGLQAGSDYNLFNGAITNFYYSKAASPQGFPQWFNYTPTWTGFSSAPTGGIARFNIIERMVTVNIKPATGTSNATAMTVTLPISCTTLTNYVVDYPVRITDNSVNAIGLIEIAYSSPTVATVYKDVTGANFTATGLKNVMASFSYEI